MAHEHDAVLNRSGEFVDTNRRFLILGLVIRFFLTIVCFFGLLAGPVAANAMPKIAVPMDNCSMGGDMVGMSPSSNGAMNKSGNGVPMDHSKMNCCPLACHAGFGVALPPALMCDQDAPMGWTDFSRTASKTLSTRSEPADDPPPRV